MAEDRPKFVQLVAMLEEIVVGVLTEEVEVSPAGEVLGFTNGIRVVCCMCGQNGVCRL